MRLNGFLAVQLQMLIALAGYGTGYDGNFPFGKPTDPYGNTSYYGMRLVSDITITLQSVWMKCVV